MTKLYASPIQPDEDNRVEYLRYKYENGLLYRKYNILTGSDITTFYAFQEDISVDPQVGDESLRCRVIDLGSDNEQILYDVVSLTQEIIDFTDPVDNLAPTDIALSNNTISEISGIGTVVGTLSTFDPNIGDTHNYSIVSDPDDKFEITSNSLRLKNLLDYDTATTHEVTIRSTDQGALFFDKLFTVFVQEQVGFVNDKATLFQGDTQNQYMLGPATNTVIGTNGAFSVSAWIKKDNPTPKPEIPPTITDLQLWLDANETSTITESGGAISQWDDRSGNDNHATQATETNKPTYLASGYGDRSVVQFDGSDDWMSGDMSLTAEDEWTIFVVGKFNQLTQGTNDYDYLIGLGQSAAEQMVSVSRTSGNYGTPNAYYLYDGADVNLGPTITGQVWNQYTVRVNNSSTFHELWIDGASQTVDNFDEAVSVNGTYELGRFFPGTHHLNGEIAEIVIYNRALNETERQDVEDYLNNKWALGNEPDIMKPLVSFCNIFLRYNQSDKLEFQYLTAGGIGTLEAQGTYGDDEWHNVVAKYDSVLQLVSLSVDGVQEDSASAVLIPRDTEPVRIAADEFLNKYLDALVDEVAIYDALVSANAIYNDGLAQDLLSNGSLPTPKAWLRMGDQPDSYTTTDGIGDRSGNGNDFTAQNMSASNAVDDSVPIFPPFSDTLSLPFNGTTQYVEIPSNGSDFSQTDDFSLSIWIKYDVGAGGGTATLIGNMHNTQGGTIPYYVGYRLRNVATRKLSFQFISNNGSAYTQRVITANAALSEDTWYHVVATYGGATLDDISSMKIYVDGSEVAVTNSTNDTLNASISTAHELSLGARHDHNPTSPTQFFKGKLNEPAVFDKELSASEVTDLYNAGSPGDIAEDIGTTNLKHWKGLGEVDGDDENTCKDRLNLSGDGTLYNYAPNPYSTDVP